MISGSYVRVECFLLEILFVLRLTFLEDQWESWKEIAAVLMSSENFVQWTRFTFLSWGRKLIFLTIKNSLMPSSIQNLTSKLSSWSYIIASRGEYGVGRDVERERDPPAE
jgi:hypothetical protein